MCLPAGDHARSAPDHKIATAPAPLVKTQVGLLVFWPFPAGRLPRILTGAGGGGGAGGCSLSGTASRTLEVRSFPPSDISAASSFGLCSTVSSTLALKCALCARPTCMPLLGLLLPVFRIDSGERATDSSLASPETDWAVLHAALDLTRSTCCWSSSSLSCP